MLMYELMAAERAAQYLREAEDDRRLHRVMGNPQPEKDVARAVAAQADWDEAPVIPNRPRPAASRRALAGAFLGFAAIGALRWRR